MSSFSSMQGACLVGLAMFLPVAAAAADLALVIGNGDYRSAPDAVSARPDASAVADRLEIAGYEVLAGTDVDRTEMRGLLARFADRASTADRVVVYYAGHAIRSGGRSYLAPTDQANATVVQVMMDGVPFDLLLGLAAQAAGRAVVFVDAAQLDGYAPRPFAEPGLAAIDAPEGVLVVSAAPPGRAIARSRARRSDFNRDVLEKFLAPGNRIGSAVRDLGGPGWVTGDIDSALTLVPEGHAPTPDDRAGDVDADTPERDAPTRAEAESALDLGPGERRDIQRWLTRLGYDTRGIDGIFGPGTRRAIRRWQDTNDQPVTGYLTDEQVSRLSRQAREEAPEPAPEPPPADEAAWERIGPRRTGNELRDYLSRHPDGAHAADARSALRRMAERGTDRAAERERAAWRDAEAVDRRWSYRDYLDRFPHGIWAPEARDRLAELDGRRRETRDPEAREDALALGMRDRLSVEQRLAYLGYRVGRQDGFLDDTTRRAIENYQRDRGYGATGFLDRETLSGIIEETRGARVGGVTGPDILLDLLRNLTDQR